MCDHLMDQIKSNLEIIMVLLILAITFIIGAIILNLIPYTVGFAWAPMSTGGTLATVAMVLFFARAGLIGQLANCIRTNILPKWATCEPLFNTASDSIQKVGPLLVAVVAFCVISAIYSFVLGTGAVFMTAAIVAIAITLGFISAALSDLAALKACLS